MSGKKKKPTKKSAPSFLASHPEFKSIVMGWFLVFLAVLVFFGSTQASVDGRPSTVASFIKPLAAFFYGPAYPGIFAPPIFLLGLLIAFQRLAWNIVRLVGLILYWISVTSLYAWWKGATVLGAFDIHAWMASFWGTTPAVLLFIGGILTSLYLMFRISYRKILAHVHGALPTIADVKEAVKDMKREVSEDAETEPARKKKNAKEETEYIRKNQELEAKIQALMEAREKESEQKQTKIAFGKDKKIAVEVIRSNGSSASSEHATEEKKKPGLLASFAGFIDRDNDEEEGVADTGVLSDAKAAALAAGASSMGAFGPGKPATQRTEFVPGKPNFEPEEETRPTFDFSEWELPPAKMLNTVQHKSVVDPKEIEQKSLEIQRALLQFGIDVEMMGQKVGPTVVQYRLKPAEGVRLSKIENLKKDLALALKAKSIRIQAPIPGLGLVGIEVPNDTRDTVSIREVIDAEVFTKHKSPLALVLGKDINGDYVVADLAKMPHLLIAGQTGSGKSVGMNGFLLSLLYKNSPSDLKMIMVDPKRVELGIYNGIPHLLAPVINEPDKALNSLKWSVAEMIRRYDVLQRSNARNLSEFNAKASKKEHMPYIVVVVDELADLMMSGNKKEVENAIARIAQMGRAAGMHLMIATQRPSVDVITGLIKANIPSRIAFTVASLTDSRTILDRMGAEDLLGMGDMLYAPTGAPAPERVQGVYVTTEEVESVVNHIKRTIDPAMLEDLYDQSIIDGDRGTYEWAMTDGVGGDSEYDEDPKKVQEAIAIVRESGKASASMLQRRMKLGYSRAARMIDILEEMSIVGPADGSKPRDVIG